MPKASIDTLIKRAIERYRDGEYEPPVSLMDRPNTVLFPILEQDASPMPQNMGSPLGEFAMQMGEQAMGGMMGAPGGALPAPGGGGSEMDMMAALMGGGAGGGDPMMGGVDAAAMMMQPGAAQGPQPGPLPEEQMPIPGVS
jgi:hypothetical protein